MAFNGAESLTFSSTGIISAQDAKTGAAASARRPGRPKGARNKVGRDARELLARDGLPAIKALCNIAAGRAVYRTLKSGKGREKVVPELADMIAAQKAILSRLVPELKATDHTSGGKSVTVQLTPFDMGVLGRPEWMSPEAWAAATRHPDNAEPAGDSAEPVPVDVAVSGVREPERPPAPSPVAPVARRYEPGEVMLVTCPNVRAARFGEPFLVFEPLTDGRARWWLHRGDRQRMEAIVGDLDAANRRAGELIAADKL